MSLRDFGPNELMFLLMATRWTILLALITFVGGGVLGLVDRGAHGSRPLRPLRWLAVGYIQFFMGTPILIQLFMIYYGSSFLGYRPDVWFAAALTFCLNAGGLLRRDLPRLHRGDPEGPVGGVDGARLPLPARRCGW